MLTPTSVRLNIKAVVEVVLTELIILQKFYFFNCVMTTTHNFYIFSVMYDARLNDPILYTYVLYYNINALTKSKK